MRFELGNKKTYEKKVKATMLLVNIFGLTISRFIWLSSVEVAKKDSWNTWKTAPLALKIFYTEKGKRKNKGVKIENVSIALGWQDEMFTDSLPENATTILFEKNKTFEEGTNQLKNILITTIK
jgi:hypothetical protein